MKNNLYEETIHLLEQAELTVEEIGRGVGMSGRWVRKVREGQIKDPGVNKIQRLYEFLSTSTAA